jgi:uncharacterized protein DUF4149
MIAALRIAQVVALGVGVGSIVFLSFVVAPALFGALPRDMAGRATAAIFPRYHLVVGVAAAVALAAGMAQSLLRSGGIDRRLFAELFLIAAMLAPVAWGGLVTLPRAAAARAILGDPARSAEHEDAQALFVRLHRRSVALNAAALAAGVAALAVSAAPWKDAAG